MKKIKTDRKHLRVVNDDFQPMSENDVLLSKLQQAVEPAFETPVFKLMIDTINTHSTRMSPEENLYRISLIAARMCSDHNNFSTSRAVANMVVVCGEALSNNLL